MGFDLPEFRAVSRGWFRPVSAGNLGPTEYEEPHCFIAFVSKGLLVGFSRARI